MTKQERLLFRQLTRCVPQIFDYSSGKTLLYIGASPSRFQFGPELFNCAYSITLLEVWQENVKHYENDERINQVINCDVRNVSKYNQLQPHDIVFWWHGPEHITKEELSRTLDALETLTIELIVLGCPWGIHEQGKSGGNPYEKHLSYLDTTDFSELGYKIDTIGIRDSGDGMNNLLAWKWIVNQLVDGRNK